MKEHVRKRLLEISMQMQRDAREQAVTKDWVLTGPTTFERYAKKIQEAVEQDEPKKQWAVLQCETGHGDGYGDASVFCTTFDDRDAALKYINDVIRNEWTTTVTIPTWEDDFHEELLADNKGYTSPDDSVKWADVHYDKDGEFAWYQRDGITKKIGLAEVKPNGERFWI